MSRAWMKSSPKWLFAGLLAVACGGPLETPSEPSSSPLASQESELCAGLSVTSLTLTGASTYQGEMAGSGTWSVSTFANAIHLKYYIDGVLQTLEDRPGKSSSWYFSQTGLNCVYRHELRVDAMPMVIDSNGGRTTCTSGGKSVSTVIGEDCATNQPCANCHAGPGLVTKAATGSCSREAAAGPDPMHLFERISAQ